MPNDKNVKEFLLGGGGLKNVLKTIMIHLRVTGYFRTSEDISGNRW